jgi:hypothetical protein
MNYVPFDSNQTLVRIRTGFFVLFSVFKKRMTLRRRNLQPGGALRPSSSERGRLTKLPVPHGSNNRECEKYVNFSVTFTVRGNTTHERHRKMIR